MSVPVSLISVDMDDLWCAADYSGEVYDGPSILPEATAHMLELFAKYNIQATLFCIGKDAKTLKPFMADIVKAGHEVANHSFAHRYNKELSLVEKREDVTAAHKALEDISGQKIVGYRAPGWGCDAEMMRLLEELDYTYDASLVVSPLYPLLRAYHGFQHGRKTYIFGSFKENLLGVCPSTNLKEIPAKSVLGLPFYGSFHLYLPAGFQVFQVQKRFMPQVVSYTFHAMDFYPKTLETKGVQRGERHFERVEEILKTLTLGRARKTMGSVA